MSCPWPVSDMAYAFKLCRKHSRSSSLLKIRLVFSGYFLNKIASWGPVRHLFLKLQILMFLSCCSFHRGLQFKASFLFFGFFMVHTFVRYIQFLCSLSAIYENKIRLMNLWGKLFVYNHFSQKWEFSKYSSSSKTSGFIASLNSTTVFSHTDITVKGFSNDKVAF